MEAVKVWTAEDADGREALRDLVRLLARLAAAEHVRVDLKYRPTGYYDEPRERS